MTQPDALARLAAAERAIQDLQGFRTAATTKVTEIDQALGAGGQRIGNLEAAVQPFAARLTALETAARNIRETQTTIQERMTVLDRAAADIRTELDALRQVARPARSVIRQDVSNIQATLQEILDRLQPQEEAPTNGGT